MDRALALGHDPNEARVADIWAETPLSVESAANERLAADGVTAFAAPSRNRLPPGRR